MYHLQNSVHRSDFLVSFRLANRIEVYSSFCMHMVIWGLIPVFIFPYHIAVMATGEATRLGISANFLSSLTFTLSFCKFKHFHISFFCLAVVTTNLALFYYRTNALLPPTHWLNHKYIKIIFYSIVFTQYIPPFFILYFEGNADQEEVKRKVFEV